MTISFLIRQFLLGISYINLRGKSVTTEKSIAELDAITQNPANTVDPLTLYKYWCLCRTAGMVFAVLWFMGSLVASALLVQHSDWQCLAAFFVGLLPLLSGHIYAMYRE